MMGSFSEEEDQFFDTHEDIACLSDSGSDGTENFNLNPGGFVPAAIDFDFWVKDPESIDERREKFLKWMSSISEEIEEDGSLDAIRDEPRVEIERITENSGAVLRNLGSQDGCFSSQSPLSYWSNEAQEFLEGVLEENSVCRIRNLDAGTEFIVDELDQNGLLRRLREAGSNLLITIEEFERSLGLCPPIQQVMQKEVREKHNSEEVVKRVNRGWLRRLGAVSCIVDPQVETGSLKSDDSHPIADARKEKVRVRSYRKRSKELSALYVGQDIVAHKGSILTMKFSPDGFYLASAGEDGVVRVWQVMESEKSDEILVSDADPSFVYFTVNHLSELVPLHVEKEKKGKLSSLWKASDTACVIFPQKVFWISNKPCHEFHGHCGDVLDLSWSKNKVSISIEAT